MATVFDLFKQISFEYLEVARGGVLGNTIVSRTVLNGVFKLRSGMTQSPSNMEVSTSDATLHVHPEDFTDFSSIVGNGVSIDGVYYQIVGITEGKNFHNGITEHLTLTLEVADYASVSS